MDLPTLGTVRYPLDAGATWKQADDGGQDAVVDTFLDGWRRLARRGDRTRVRSALTRDQAEALLIYCRRRWLDGRDGAFDALSVFDLNRLPFPMRAEAEFTAAVTVFISAARGKTPAVAAASALRVAHQTMAKVLTGLISRPPSIADLGHRWVWVQHPGMVLLSDMHPERPFTLRDPELLVRLAALAETCGYRVEAVALHHDLPVVLIDKAADDPAVALAVDEIREQSVVRCGPGRHRDGGMTAHLLRTVTTEAAATIAAAVHAPPAVITHEGGAACVIYLMEGVVTDSEGLFGTRYELYGASTEPGEIEREKPPMPVPGAHRNIDTFLMIEVQYGSGPLYQWWLAGPPPHGTHPDPEGAWEALVADGDPFRGLGMSTQDYHGPERAVVRGFWRGTWVEHRFGRHVGAAAHQWADLRPFLEPTEFRPVRNPPE